MEPRVPRNSAEGKREEGVSGGGKQRERLGAASHCCHCPDSEGEEQAAKSRERNEKAKKFRAGGALEWEDSTVLV